MREVRATGDTLYVRLFTRGMVEVNPYDHGILGVASEDSRFTFWLPAEDLAAEPVDWKSVRTTWTAPSGTESDPDYFELRYSTAPITDENLDAATPFAPNPTRTQASIRFAVAPGTGPVLVAIYDVGGRLVRTLVDGLSESGRYAETWNGLDAQGVRAAAGPYFVRMSWPDGGDGGTLLLLR